MKSLEILDVMSIVLQASFRGNKRVKNVCFHKWVLKDLESTWSSGHFPQDLQLIALSIISNTQFSNLTYQTVNMN